MGIKMVNVARITASVQPDINEAIARVVESGYYAGGPEVEKFERKWADYVGTARAVGVSSGLDAIRGALNALEIQPLDRVLLPANTYTATAMAVTSLGAVPVLCDVDEDSFLMTPTTLFEEFEGREIKPIAVIPVHLTGLPCYMPAICGIADRYGAAVVEDCAQAHGATVDGRDVGSFGVANAFSFFPAKNLGALGDAGAVTTNSHEIANSVARWRNQGQNLSKRYDHVDLGVCARMDAIQAAVLDAKLDMLEPWNRRRREIARTYRSELEGVGDLLFQELSPRREHVYHLFVIRTARRDDLQLFLADRGIETTVHYPVPIHLQPAFSWMGMKEGAFPITERLARTSLSIPVDPTMTEDELQTVIGCIRDFFRRL